MEITPALVESLLAEQHPDLLGRELRLFGSGWDNTTYRLGDDLAIRLPRRKLGAEMMVKEQRWVRHLAKSLPLPIGRPKRLGRPGCGYPWPWSIVEWTNGVSAEVESPQPAEAARLGAFLRALHQPAPPDAPDNPWRGGPLGDRAFSVEQRLERLTAPALRVSADRIASAWNRAAQAHPYTAAPTWLHGDMHPRNVIVADGRIAAVIDWGDLCRGDPATDLAAAWMLFPVPVHQFFREAYGPVADSTWERACGWAIFFGVVMVDAGRVDDQRWAECGNLTLERACG